MGHSSLDHIGIFVRSIEESAQIYERLGFSVDRTIDFRRANGRRVRVALVEVGNGIELELLEDPEAVAEGVQALNHICFSVDDVHVEHERLRSLGVPFESDSVRRGVTSPAIMFLLPEAADGVRIELAQRSGTDD